MNIKVKKISKFHILTLVSIIVILGIASTGIISQVSAEPKEQKQSSHSKSTYDPETGESSVKGGYNTNGREGHQNCKYSVGTSEPPITRCHN